jgi:hypothetical protein
VPKTDPAPSKVEEKALAKLNGSGPIFVRCELSKVQKEQLVHWASETDTEDAVKWMFAKAESGHVVSLRTNEVGFQCSITGVFESSGHKDLCLVARASTAEKALYAAMFRDVVVLEGLWPRTGRLDELDF